MYKERKRKKKIGYTQLPIHGGNEIRNRAASEVGQRERGRARLKDRNQKRDQRRDKNVWKEGRAE